ncbi:MAG: nucleotide sugar dehydrogenase [Bacillota bacterium]
MVGLGYVGLSVAAVLAQRGCRVYGIDCRKEIVDRVKAGICPLREPGMDDLVRRVVSFGRLTAHCDARVAGEAGIVILAVGTPPDENHRPDKSQLFQALDDIAPWLKKGQALFIKSTVPPGVTREVAGYLAEKTGLNPGSDIDVACCPERLAEGRIIADLWSIPVVVGGLTPENTAGAVSFWAGLGWEVIPVSGPEEAEMAKLADNLWIDLNIALANELWKVCHRLNINVMEVIAAANTLPKGTGKVNILFPGPGVGGSCLVKDPWFLHHHGLEKGLALVLPAAGRKVNESMPDFIVEVLGEGLARRGLGLSGARVAVLGLSFKQETGDTRYSPTVPLIGRLWSAGAALRVYDPWVEPGHARELTKGMAAVESSLAAAVAGCDAVVFMVGHPEFLRGSGYWREIVGSECLLLDCRNIFDPGEMAGAGLNYVAPGRPVLL